MILELPGTGETSTPGKRLTMGLFHFSNNNLAVRKSCIADVGLYDLGIPTSEDVDLSFRVALSKDWIACREPGMLIRHKARKDLAGLVKQMWGWGSNLAGPYQRVRTKGLYLYWVSSKTLGIARSFEAEHFPLFVCAMPTIFHAMHLGALLCAVLAMLSLWPAFMIALVWTLWMIRRWADPALHGSGGELRRGLELVALHYIANTTFFAAAFSGGLRRGMLLVPASIFPPRGNSEHA